MVDCDKEVGEKSTLELQEKFPDASVVFMHVDVTVHEQLVSILLLCIYYNCNMTLLSIASK